MTNWEHPGLLYVFMDNVINIFFSSVYTRYIRGLGLKGTERILDFGSGSGSCSRHLAALLQNGGHLTCVDTSRFLTGKARKRLRRYTNVDFQVGELPELGLPGESFDAVFVHYALHEVSAASRPRYVREFSRLLKNHGKLFIKEPTGEHDGMPKAEIQALMAMAGLKELSFSEEKGKVCTGVYTKAPD